MCARAPLPTLVLRACRSEPLDADSHRSQFFYTELRIAVASARASGPTRLGLSAIGQRFFTNAQIVLDSLLDDAKDVVKVQVRAELKPLLADSSHPQYPSAYQRNVALKGWLEERRPLSYGPGSSVATFITLVKIVCASHVSYPNGLPESGRPKWSRSDFIENIYKQGLHATSSHYRAPIVPKGSLGPTLRIAIQHVRNIDPRVSHEAADRDFKNALFIVFTENCVDFVPDARVPEGGGAPPRQPSIHAWTRLGAVDKDHDFIPGSFRSEEERNEAALGRTARAQVREDTRGSWNTVGLAVNDLHGYFSRSCMPVNFNTRKALVGKVVEGIHTTYAWACARLNSSLGSDWRCQLAVILAFLISKAVPRVSWPVGFDNPGGFSNPDPWHAIGILRKLPWIEKIDGNGETRKGTTNESLFFSCAAVVFLAWLDPNSPLRERIGSGPTDFLTAWNSKHGVWPTYHPRIIPTHRSH